MRGTKGENLCRESLLERKFLPEWQKLSSDCCDKIGTQSRCLVSIFVHYSVILLQAFSPSMAAFWQGGFGTPSRRSSRSITSLQQGRSG